MHQFLLIVPAATSFSWLFTMAWRVHEVFNYENVRLVKVRDSNNEIIHGRRHLHVEAAIIAIGASISTSDVIWPMNEMDGML